jgi:hypothetical protein
VGPRDGLNGCGKSGSLGFDPRTVRPVVSFYTKRAIPAPCGTAIQNLFKIKKTHTRGAQVFVLRSPRRLNFVLCGTWYFNDTTWETQS